MIERMKECPSYSKMLPDDGVSYEDLVEAEEMTIKEVEELCKKQNCHALCSRNFDDTTKCKLLRTVSGEGDWDKMIADKCSEIFLFV